MKQKHPFLRHNYPSLAIGAILLVAISTVQAQRTTPLERVHLPVQRPGSIKAAPAPLQMTGLEDFNPVLPSVPGAAPTIFRNVLTEEIAGTTAFDNQSNGTEQSRIHVWPNGEVTTAWTMSHEEETTSGPSNYTDRGTGYNTRTNWLTDNTPTTRLESERTGFTNYVVTADGTEMTFAHRAAGGVYYIRMCRKVAGSGTWVQSDIPSAVPKGSLWTKTATDGNNVYVLSLTTPVTPGIAGAIYKGVNGHVIFHRSKDAGATWDIVDGIIPGLDSSAFAQIAGDSYCIDARDGVVAVGIFDSWNSAKIFKSLDGGTTWGEPMTVIDFPLTKYVTDQGYTIDDIGGADPNAPSTTTDLEIFSSDKNASILIDNLGYVHAWVGRMYVLDEVLTDENTSYYPGVNGLMYWNELDPLNLYVIAGAPDLDGNGTLDITGSLNDVAYGCNISSMPTSAISQNDTLYVAYSAIIEGLNDGNGLPLRHVLLIKSGDNGQTWQDMYDVHYQTQDPSFGDYQEGARPYFSKRIGSDGVLHLIYMQDYDAGSYLTGSIGGVASNIPGQANMVYLANPTLTGIKSPEVKIDLNVSPNPASDHVRITCNLDYDGPAQLEVFNALGARVYDQAFNVQNGGNVLNIHTENLGDGIYLARINAGRHVDTRKFIIAR